MLKRSAAQALPRVGRTGKVVPRSADLRRITPGEQVRSPALPTQIACAPRSSAVADPQPNQNETQRKYKEFMELLPLTLALAGLPPSEVGRYFGEEQIETRVFA